MNFWVDTHAHVYMKEFLEDRAEVFSRCLLSGVEKILMPNIDHTSIDNMLEVESKYPTLCFPMMGIHPCSVNQHFEKELYLVESWLAKKKFYAIGEIGTDTHWGNTHFEQQKEAFKIQVGWAKKYNLPIVIHCRNTIDETLDLLDLLIDEKLMGIFHCFSGTNEQLKRIVDIGFYVGIGGVCTFKNSSLKEIIPNIPIEKLVLETDAPYLAPVPHRGKRNEPSYIPLIAEKISLLTSIPISEIQKQTTMNALKLFTDI